MINETSLPYELRSPFRLRGRDTRRNELVLDRHFIVSVDNFEQTVELCAIIDRKVWLRPLVMPNGKKGEDTEAEYVWVRGRASNLRSVKIGFVSSL